MDVAKVAKDYFLSSQSRLLIPNREYGSRKIVKVGLTRSISAGNVHPSSPSSKTQVSTPPGHNTNPGGAKGLRNLLAGATSSQSRALTLRQKSQAMRAAAIDEEMDRLDLRATTSSKQWQHPPESLLAGHIVYSVKFLGECAVDQPKGTEVVKEAIQKMKFNKHIKRAEGQKPPKVELAISAEAVCILDSKSKFSGSSQILHQYPLHRISYCADDKSDKKMFTFIAKEANGNKHFCYVFDSEKCAEEITLTIGQAFDLAYKKFLEQKTTDTDIRGQFLMLQKKAQTLQYENATLRKRVAELEKLKDRSDVEEYKRNNQISDLGTVTLDLRESSTDDIDSPSGNQTTKQSSVVGRRLENLILSDDSQSSSVSQTNGTHNAPAGSVASHAATPILNPPPSNTRSNRANSLRSQSSTSSTPGSPGNPFLTTNTNLQSPTSVDPFGMEAFSPPSVPSEQLMDIQAGFSRGLSFGTDDFNLDDLDPLNQK